MNSNNLLYIISIDSFFNGILFLLIFNIKLSKKDKIEYYNSFLLSIKIRYLYFFILWIFSIFISCLFYCEIDISILSIPIFVYLFYNKLYFHKVVNWINKKLEDKIEFCVSFTLYNIIQFLCKTVLSEETNIKQIEIMIFYKKVGLQKLLEFSQSFVLACVYEYISANYTYLGYVFNYNNFRDNYDKKQHILGLLNSKDWDKLFHSSTINLFFNIYKNSNNRQIAKYIHYQINRFQYKLLIFFSVWSIVGYMNNNLLIPFLFYYIYIDIWKENWKLFMCLSFFSIVHYEYLISILFFTIPSNFHYEIVKWIKGLNYNYYRISFTLLGSFISLFEIEYQLGYIFLGLFLSPKLSIHMMYYTFFGYWSNYNLKHTVILQFIHQLYELFKDNSI
jgi:hypothetical protein